MTNRTPAQEWATKRNWLKLRIKSALSISYGNQDVLTDVEEDRLQRAESILRSIIDEWDGKNEISKQRYLRKKGDK